MWQTRRPDLLRAILAIAEARATPPSLDVEQIVRAALRVVDQETPLAVGEPLIQKAIPLRHQPRPPLGRSRMTSHPFTPEPGSASGEHSGEPSCYNCISAQQNGYNECNRHRPPAFAEPSDEALRLIERAEKAVDDLCSGRLRWEMRVPAEPDHDPDLIISTALRAARTAIAEARATPPSLDENHICTVTLSDGTMVQLQDAADLIEQHLRLTSKEERPDG
jgi:hypothetical protein